MTSQELRFKNHMLAEHEVGEEFYCDDCEYTAKDRNDLKGHVESDHVIEYKMCGGNCTDRMYEENSFMCGKCDHVLCIICSKTEINENSVLDADSSYCWTCATE